MTQQELDPTNQFKVADPPLRETAPISDFEHRLNYGRAALGGVLDRFSGVVDSFASKAGGVPDAVSSAVSSIPSSSKSINVLGATAVLLPSAVFGVGSASGDSSRLPSAKMSSVDRAPKMARAGSGSVESKVFGANAIADTGRFVASKSNHTELQTATSSVTGGAASIKFYKGTSKKAIGMITSKFADCAPYSLISEPHPYFKDQGRDRNKTGVLRTLFFEDGLQQKGYAVFRKGYRFCNLYVTTVGREIYFPPKNMIKINKNSMTYPDPFKTNDPKKRAYGTLIVAAKKIKRK